MRISPVLALCVIGACGSQETVELPDARPGLGSPVVVIATNMGDLIVQLAGDDMPLTTANFLDYVDAAFYDNTIVHRVIDDWVIQGGGFTSGLTPNNPRAPIALETSPRVGHVHGAISMARTADPDSATSQWFICDWPDSGPAPQPGSLDGQYAAFGVLIDGFDVLTAITKVATQVQGQYDDVPVQDVLVISMRRRE